MGHLDQVSDWPKGDPEWLREETFPRTQQFLGGWYLLGLTGPSVGTKLLPAVETDEVWELVDRFLC